MALLAERKASNTSLSLSNIGANIAKSAVVRRALTYCWELRLSQAQATNQASKQVRLLRSKLVLRVSSEMALPYLLRAANLLRAAHLHSSWIVASL